MAATAYLTADTDSFRYHRTYLVFSSQPVTKTTAAQMAAAKEAAIHAAYSTRTEPAACHAETYPPKLATGG